MMWMSILDLTGVLEIWPQMIQRTMFPLSRIQKLTFSNQEKSRELLHWCFIVQIDVSACNDTVNKMKFSSSQADCPAQHWRYFRIWGWSQGAVYQVQQLQCDHHCSQRQWANNQLDVLLRAQKHLLQRRLQGVRWHTGGPVKGTVLSRL